MRRIETIAENGASGCGLRHLHGFNLDDSNPAGCIKSSLPALTPRYVRASRDDEGFE